MPRLLDTKQGAVAIPRWFSALPSAQLLFAILILALTSYALSAHSESQIRPALILTIITAALTIFPTFPITIPLPTAAIHPLATLITNYIGTLLWLASLTALASYLRIFSYYRKVERIPWAPGAPHIARAWRCGVAACVFAAIELLLFLLTFKMFGYFYHHHRAGTQPHARFLRGTLPAPKTESLPLESTSVAAAAAAGGGGGGGGGFNRFQTAPAPAHQHQLHHSPPVSPLQPTASAPFASNRADHNGNDNIPSITHTAATPTTATHPHQPVISNAFAAVSPSPQGHANPIIPDPGARAVDARVIGRPPYPVDEDEEMGAVGPGHHRRDNSGGGDGGVAADTTTAGMVPLVLTPGVSER